MKALMCPRCGCGAFLVAITEKRNAYVVCISCDLKLFLDQDYLKKTFTNPEK